MPRCKKCGNGFPNTIVIDGKQRVLNRRKYCLDCSPFGLHNTKTLEAQNEEGTLCPKCKTNRVYTTRSGRTKALCTTCQSRAARRKRKKQCLDYKGGCCQICGYKRCLEALTFHHLNPTTKEFQISGNHCRKWELVKAELDKCVLLCSNCHHEAHEGLIDL